LIVIGRVHINRCIPVFASNSLVSVCLFRQQHRSLQVDIVARTAASKPPPPRVIFVGVAEYWSRASVWCHLAYRATMHAALLWNNIGLLWYKPRTGVKGFFGFLIKYAFLMVFLFQNNNQQ